MVLGGTGAGWCRVVVQGGGAGWWCRVVVQGWWCRVVVQGGVVQVQVHHENIVSCVHEACMRFACGLHEGAQPVLQGWRWPRAPVWVRVGAIAWRTQRGACTVMCIGFCSRLWHVLVHMTWQLGWAAPCHCVSQAPRQLQGIHAYTGIHAHA